MWGAGTRACAWRGRGREEVCAGGVYGVPARRRRPRPRPGAGVPRSACEVAGFLFEALLLASGFFAAALLFFVGSEGLLACDGGER